MKVNHRSPAKKLGDNSAELSAARATISKLRSANEAAVRRAAALTVEVEALKKAIAELRAKWEAAHNRGASVKLSVL